MNQAEVAKLIASLRINVGLKPLKVKHSYWGYRGGLDKTRESLTKLLVDERVEVSQYNGIVLRQYTERLISDAIMYGDKHKPTMEMASWWLDSDKSAVHKLFKVLVPRFQDFSTSYTRLFYSPKHIRTFEEHGHPKHFYRSDRVVVELKGHPFPQLSYSNTKPNKRHIHNVLLSEAAKEFMK